LVHVVAAAVLDSSGRVLIAQRPPGKHMAGGWEFPGGKLEPDEERLAGLARELQEELGIAIAPERSRPLIRVRHSYPSREVLLDVWVIKHYSGEPRGLDGQALRWCTEDDLARVQLLPADGPVVAALRLPERLTQISSTSYSIVDLAAVGGITVTEHARCAVPLKGVFCTGAVEAAAAARAGAEFLVLRRKLSPSEIAELCGSVSVPTYARGLKLAEAWALGATGTNEIEN
jgi:mutator protein MutT